MTKTINHRWKSALIIFGIIVLVVILSLYAFGIFVTNGIFSHRVEKFEYTPEELELVAETIPLTSTDGISLKGWWIPAEQLEGVVIVLHGMDGLDTSSTLPHAQFLHEAGYAVFALDMRAHGRSAGNRIGLAFEEPQDVIAVLDWLQTKPELTEKPVILLGLSMGGATAIRTAAMRQDVNAVISVSAYASVDRVMMQGMKLMGMPDTASRVFAPFMQLGMLTLYRVWPASASPIHDIAHISPRSILLIHGTADSQIPVENAHLLKEAAGETASLWIVEGAEHLIFTETGNGQTPEDRIYREHILDFIEYVVKE